MKRIIHISVVLCLLAACGTQNRRPRTAEERNTRPENRPFESKYDSAVEFWDETVPERRELKGDSLFLLARGAVVSVLVLDDYVVFHNRPSPNTLSVRTMDGGEMIAEFQYMGRGPYDVLSGMEISYSPRRNSFSFCDRQLFKILEYDVEPFLKKMDERRRSGFGVRSMDNVVPSRVFEFGRSGIYRGFPDDEKIISQLWAVGFPPLGIYSPAEGKLTSKFGTYPEDSGLSEWGMWNAFESHMAVDSDNRRVALFHRYVDLIEIYDVDSGERLVRRHGPDGFYPRFVERASGNMHMTLPIGNEARTAYFGCIERGGLLWASYGGFYYSEEYYTPIIYIYVFDWDGNPQMMFTLDRSSTAFDVDTDNRIIYTVAEDRETGDSYLCKYEY